MQGFEGSGGDRVGGGEDAVEIRRPLEELAHGVAARGVLVERSFDDELGVEGLAQGVAEAGPGHAHLSWRPPDERARQRHPLQRLQQRVVLARGDDDHPVDEAAVQVARDPLGVALGVDDQADELLVGLGEHAVGAQQDGADVGVPELRLYVLTGSLVSILPLIVVFLLLQRFWRTGLGTGSIK